MGGLLCVESSARILELRMFLLALHVFKIRKLSIQTSHLYKNTPINVPTFPNQIALTEKKTSPFHFPFE